MNSELTFTTTCEVSDEGRAFFRSLYDQSLTISTTVPAPGERDMDWTEPFLERGTKMTYEGAGIERCEVPVTRAWVKDEVLHVEGQVTFNPLPT